ncbi:TerD family protein [Sphingobium aromaticiconvertens]|uniref:TerD family protein n=1 Tax=Sphingobium aromaticiconvertens TaxID=365341 RepID=UPI00301957F3
MSLMQPGEKRQIADISSSRQIRITASHAPADIDIAAFGLNSDRRIEDDRYVVLFSNERSPEGALAFAKSGETTTISVDLDRLPADIHRVTITATHDTIPLRQAGVLKAEIGSVTIDAKASLGDEKAIMLLELYRHGGDWRLGSIVQGFNGGLAALVKHFGGDVADEPTPAAPAAAAPSPSPVSLSKVDLRKQKVGISLKKLGIEHEKAEITFVIDASGSMASLYSKGVVQETVERIAPVALRLDDDGSMATWFYASRCKQVEDLTATCPPSAPMAQI